MNKAASELGKLRWKNTTKAERQQAIADLHAARAAKLTPEERSAIAKKASAARWADKKKAGAKKAAK